MSRISSRSIAISCSCTSALALGGEVAGGAHRERIRDHPGNARHHHGVGRQVELALGAEHAGDQTEVRGEPVVEAVDQVPEDAAGTGLVPRLALGTHQPGQRLGVLRRLLGQGQRRGAGGAIRSLAVHHQVALDLPSLLFKQHGGQKPRSEPPSQPGHASRPGGGPECGHRMATLAQQLLPELHVAILDPGEPAIEVGPAGVVLQRGEGAVEERGVGLVLEMVQPVMWGGGRRGNRSCAKSSRTVHGIPLSGLTPGRRNRISHARRLASLATPPATFLSKRS